MTHSASTATLMTRPRAAALVVAAVCAALLLPLSGAHAAAWPTTIGLPDGFQPEGIATGPGRTFFAGSIPTGAVVRGDLRTGEVTDFVPAQEGRQAIGMSYRDGVLFVAGGSTGDGYAYDARTGDNLALFELTREATFVNDVVATTDAAYFTDSFNQQMYRVPIEGDGSFGAPQTVPLTGDIDYIEGFNANGIDATRDGSTLILVQSNTGQLFTVDPNNGEATEIELGGETVPMGDGILLDGRRLWVVQNFLNLLTLVKLDGDLGSGVVVSRTTHEDFAVPTTVARFGNRLALVNARFDVAPGPDVEYWVTQLRWPI